MWQQWEVNSQVEAQTGGRTRARPLESQPSPVALSTSAGAGTQRAGSAPTERSPLGPGFPAASARELLPFEKILFFRIPDFLRRRGDRQAAEQQS